MELQRSTPLRKTEMARRTEYTAILGKYKVWQNYTTSYGNCCEPDS